MRHKQQPSTPPSATPLSSGSLIAFEYPDGFDKNGRHSLKKCQEFELFELYKPGGEQVVETAPEIEHALWRSLFRINDSWILIPGKRGQGRTNRMGYRFEEVV